MSGELFGGRAPRLWVRLEQHSDKPFYNRVPPEMIDGFVINANLVESSPEACGAFLNELRKPYVIDPMSYRFERPKWYRRPKDGADVPKHNYARLWGAYAKGVPGLSGDPLDDAGVVAGMTGTDLATFCRNVIDFQELRLAREWAVDGIQYSMTEALFGSELAPTLYIAPYVVIGGSDSRADARRSALLASTTAGLAHPRRVGAVLPLEEGALRDYDLMRDLAARTAESGVQTVLLWTVGLSALRLADTAELFTGSIILIRNLRDAGVEVGLLYGGILASLLRGFGVSGFSHGLLYGETRGLEPSGGMARAAFYFPPLRDSLPYAEARSLVASMSPREYLDTVCKCRVCEALLDDGAADVEDFFATWVPDGAKRPFPLSTALDLNRLHFLFARAAELEFTRERTETELIADLADAAERLPPRVTRTLRAWTARLRAA